MHQINICHPLDIFYLSVCFAFLPLSSRRNCRVCVSVVTRMSQFVTRHARNLAASFRDATRRCSEELSANTRHTRNRTRRRFNSNLISVHSTSFYFLLIAFEPTVSFFFILFKRRFSFRRSAAYDDDKDVAIRHVRHV